jgi:hypothetical protein
MAQQYEIVAYDESVREIGRFNIVKNSDAAARSHAGRLAVQNSGPVDLARAGAADWDERYITTASPSAHHVTGYRFERLA